MLTEPVIVVLVKDYLTTKGYTGFIIAPTRSHGDDLVATSPRGDFTLHVEAKGETSSDERSKRYGKQFSSAQYRDHAATAIYKALCMRSYSTPEKPRKVALALPDNRSKRNFLTPTEAALRELGIGVFWVRPDKSVVFDADWSL